MTLAVGKDYMGMEVGWAKLFIVNLFFFFRPSLCLAGWLVGWLIGWFDLCWFGWLVGLVCWLIG